jgi:hypothetical protein
MVILFLNQERAFRWLDLVLIPSHMPVWSRSCIIPGRVSDMLPAASFLYRQPDKGVSVPVAFLCGLKTESCGWGVGGGMQTKIQMQFAEKSGTIFRYSCYHRKYILDYLTSQDRLCGLMVRVLGYRSRGPGSIPGATRFSEK